MGSSPIVPAKNGMLACSFVVKCRCDSFVIPWRRFVKRAAFGQVAAFHMRMWGCSSGRRDTAAKTLETVPHN